MTVTGSREALKPFGYLSQPHGATKWDFSETRPDLSQGAFWTVVPVYTSPDPAGVTLTVEMIAREVRRAMLDNPTEASFNKRAAARERIADEYARTILALIQKSVQPSIVTLPATSGTAAPVCELGDGGAS